MEPPLVWGTKVCSGGLGHMTKMAPTPIYGKNPFKNLEPKDQWLRGLVCSIWDLGPTKFVQMMTLGWPWHFYSKVKFASWCFYMGKYTFLQEKYKKVILWKKLTTNDRSDKTFLLTSKCFVPKGCLPLPQVLYMYKSMKKICIKSDFSEIFLKPATNGQSDKAFLLTSTARGIYMYKMKKCT